MPECYIRGNTIKYLRVPDEVRVKYLNLSYYDVIQQFQIKTVFSRHAKFLTFFSCFVKSQLSSLKLISLPCVFQVIDKVQEETVKRSGNAKFQLANFLFYCLVDLHVSSSVSNYLMQSVEAPSEYLDVCVGSIVVIRTTNLYETDL